MTVTLPAGLRLERFAFDKMTQADFEAFTRFANEMRRENLPDSPPRSVAYSVNNLKSLEGFDTIDFRLWFVRQDEAYVAQCYTDVSLEDDNPHLMQASIEVVPSYRRRGIATALLHLPLKTASELDRTLVIGTTNSRTLAGTKFMKTLGAKAGLEGKVNQLILAEVPAGLVETWLKEAEVRAADYELGLWDGPIPDADLTAAAEMMQVMNTAPRDELDMEDEAVTPERVREFERYNKERGVTRWLYYVRHKATGELAGYTEVALNPEEPETAWQGDTGVLPAHRGHGLGRLLKASMIHKIRNERPEVKRIRTGNADSNEHMLAINHALGFKPYHSWTDWQVDVEAIKTYLSKKGTR